MKKLRDPHHHRHHVLWKQAPYLRKAFFLRDGGGGDVVEYVREIVNGFKKDTIPLLSIHKKCSKYITSTVNACLMVMYDNGEIEITRIPNRTSFIDGITKKGV